MIKTWSKFHLLIIVRQGHSVSQFTPRISAKSTWERMQFFLWETKACVGGFFHVQIALDTLFTFAILDLLPYQQRLSRVAEGTGPTTPQQPGPCAKVLIPAQWGEIRSSTDRNPG
jgi:hypothetical protein